MNFSDFDFSKELEKAIEKSGFHTPTLVQEKSIPYMLRGRDMLVQSATGSGKTLVFGCGIMERVEPKNGVQALVLTPTRELAEQVKTALKEITHLKVTAVYGGVSIGPQTKALTRAEIVVATPGRLMDHMQRGTIDMSTIRMLVLDEADRMLDMGFIRDIEKIMSQCPKKRQTLLFSATIPDQICKLSKRFLNNPVKVDAEKQVDPSKLEQIYFDVDSNVKFSLLVHMLKKDKPGLAMIFCNTRLSADAVGKGLSDQGIKTFVIHGGFTQQKRLRSIEDFKRGGVLVCTDVAARGIHIDNVAQIYNYDIPKNPIEYVHRIGRTARAGEKGKVINILSKRDHDNFRRLINEYRDFKIKEMHAPYVEKITIQMRPQRTYGRDSHRNGSDRRSSFNRRGSGGSSRGQSNRGQTGRFPKRRGRSGMAKRPRS